MRKLQFVLPCVLLLGCSHNNQSNDYAEDLVQIEPVLTELVRHHDALKGTMMIMDVSTGDLIEDCTIKKDVNGNYVKSTPDSITPGSLYYSMFLADMVASGVTLDTSMMVRVGQKSYSCGLCIEDSRRIMDNGAPLDSVTFGRAFVERSKVAMCELAEMSNNGQSNASVDFYMKALGYGEKMSPYDILRHYNALAKGGGDTVVIRSLLARVVEEGYAGRYADKDILLAGMPATLGTTNDSFPKYTAFAGFFPTEKPKYSCLVILYSTTANSINVIDAIYSIVK